MLDFLQKQLAKVENDLQDCYLQRPLAGILMEGQIQIQIDNLKKERIKLIEDIKEETNLQNPLETTTETNVPPNKASNNTDGDQKHIIDELYYCLKRFEPLKFIDPNFIANLYPFNILDEQVWHYRNGHLFTINPKIYSLLSHIEIKENELIFSELLQNQIKQNNVDNAQDKLKEVFIYLNYSTVFSISAVKNYKQIQEKAKNIIGFSLVNIFSFESTEGIWQDIVIDYKKVCNCLSCTYKNFKFDVLLKQLKQGFGQKDKNTFEYAYGNYLMASNNFVTSYEIYTKIEERNNNIKGKVVEKFLARLNISKLHGLINTYYDYGNRDEILKSIKQNDIYLLLYDSSENIEEDVKKYLILLKENGFIYSLEGKLDAVLERIERRKSFFENGGIEYQSNNFTEEIYFSYTQLYYHINQNFLIGDMFGRYKLFVQKMLRGIIMAYLTKNTEVKEIPDFILTESIIHIDPQILKEILKDVETLPTNPNSITEIINRLHDFLSSSMNNFFGYSFTQDLQCHLNNILLRQNYKYIWSNLFMVLSKSNIDNNDFNKVKNIIVEYINVENVLEPNDIKYFSDFILLKGHLFCENALQDLIQIGLRKSDYYYIKHDNFITSVIIAISKFYPTYRICDKDLIQRAILHCKSDEGKIKNIDHIMPLAKICDEECKMLLWNFFENYLDMNFNVYTYENLLKEADYDYNRKDYFGLYAKYINAKRGSFHKLNTKKVIDDAIQNYARILYKFRIDFNISASSAFENINDAESWLLNPIDFDYNKFNVEWLLEVKNPIFLERLKEIKEIKIEIEKSLKKQYDAYLAEMLYTYFV